MDTLDCRRCGMQWQRPVLPGRKPTLCPDCSGHAVPQQRAHAVMDTVGPAYRVAAAAVTYRLALEEIAALLRMGRTLEALAVCERVEAPARRDPVRCQNTRA